MNWRLQWFLWAAVCVAFVIITFATLEHMGWEEGHTLSRAVAELPKYGVFILGWIVGGVTCGLAVHFWWHWAPPDKKGIEHD